MGLIWCDRPDSNGGTPLRRQMLYPAELRSQLRTDVGLARIANACSLTAAYLLVFRRKTAHLRIMQRILVCNKVGIGIEIPNRLVNWLTRLATALAYLASTRVSSGPKDSSLTAEVSAAATTWRELAGRLNPDVVHARANLVPARGVEPPTFALRMRCSTI